MIFIINIQKLYIKVSNNLIKIQIILIIHIKYMQIIF